MKINRLLNIITLALFLLLSSWSLVANASSKPIGKIILAVGEVIAINSDGGKRKLKRRSKIFSGDTLATKSGARCQIRFSDKSLVSLSESSVFKVDEYSYNPSKGSQEKAIYSLLKGGMRSISGAIGKNNQDDYLLKTPVATIGIRGTAFNIGLISINGIQNLFGTVDSGAIVLKNGHGNLQIQPGQNFQVQINLPPKRIMSLPKLFPSNHQKPKESPDNGDGDGNGDSSGTPPEEGAPLTDFGEGDEIPPPPEEGTPPPPPPGTETILLPPPPPSTLEEDVLTPGTLAPDGAALGLSFIDSHSGEISGNAELIFNKLPDEFYIDTVDGVGNVPVAGSAYNADCDPCSFLSATGTLVVGDTGGDALGVNWGRWSGSYIMTENGVPGTTIGDFHYIYSPNVTPDTVLQNLTGTSYYNQVAGGTQPTDQNGATGTLITLSVTMNFGTQVVEDIYMSLSTPATGTIDVSAMGTLSIPISDLYDKGIALESANGFNVTTGYVGQINGTLIGPNAEGLMTTYGFKEDTSPSTKAVSGAALLIQVGM